MKRICLNKNWKLGRRIGHEDVLVPSDATDVSLPVDLLCSCPRNYNAPLGEYNGYYDSTSAAFYRVLPQLKRSHLVYLDLSGVNTRADVYLNNVYLATVTNTAHNYIDISDHYEYASKNILKIVITAPAETGKYTGAGISSGAALYISDGPIYLEPSGAYIQTVAVGEKAQLKAVVTPRNETENNKVLSVEAILFNARGKKVMRKVRKIKLSAHFSNTYELPIRLTRHYDWSETDPYLYTAMLNLYDGETLLDSTSVPFGIMRAELSAKGFTVNGKPVKLMGAVMAHDNGLLGNCSVPEAEYYKLSKIKALGYNAVRYIDVPSDVALDTLDRLGLMAVIDLYDVWSQGRFPFDGHADFKRDFFASTAEKVNALRRHPSVVMYSLGNNLPESYGRGEKADDAVGLLADVVRQSDPTRPITANASELVPLRQEIEAAGGRMSKLEGDYAQAAISFGRQKDLFRTLTEPFFAQLDVAGYSYLYPRYATDHMVNDKPVIGLATLPCRAFDAWEETDKNAFVVGDFKVTGADFLGRALGKPVYENEQIKLLPPHASYCGDLDITYQRKVQSNYREILAGHRNVSLITVVDPDSTQRVSGADHSVRETYAMWNWPRHLGQTVEIEVLSGGEVVALYLDDKLIGRKLAGKVNKHIATFKTEFYPGKLTAVSFHKGMECARCTLESVSAPRAIKLDCSAKTVTAGELSFVEISVLDKEGRVVPYAAREIEATVTGEGERVALGNGDPESQVTALSQTCPVYNGKALLIVRGTAEGKMTVKVTSDGLLSAKAAIRVKPETV